jgi:serine/threonine protein kinase
MKSLRTLKVLGAGGQGTTYAVERIKDGEIYAAKKLVCSSMPEANRALREAMTLQKLGHHPLVISYVDVFLEEADCGEEELVGGGGGGGAGGGDGGGGGGGCNHSLIVTILMEFCERGDLASLMENSRASRQPLPQTVIVRWMCELCAGLAFLHGQGVIHRDIKPPNIFIASGGGIKVGDFGLACTHQQKMSMSAAAWNATAGGTPCYLSPEVLSSDCFSPTSDVWAAGCCAFEMMSFSFLWERKGLLGMQAMSQTRNQAVLADDMMPAYNASLRSFVCSMLSKDPRERPTAASGETFFAREQARAKSGGGVEAAKQAAIKASQQIDRTRKKRGPADATAPPPAPMSVTAYTLSLQQQQQQLPLAGDTGRVHGKGRGRGGEKRHGGGDRGEGAMEVRKARGADREIVFGHFGQEAGRQAIVRADDAEGEDEEEDEEGEEEGEGEGEGSSRKGRDTAEDAQARDTAEDGRDTAEDGRDTAEDGRDTAEDAQAMVGSLTLSPTHLGSIVAPARRKHSPANALDAPRLFSRGVEGEWRGDSVGDILAHDDESIIISADRSAGRGSIGNSAGSVEYREEQQPVSLSAEQRGERGAAVAVEVALSADRAAAEAQLRAHGSAREAVQLSDGAEFWGDWGEGMGLIQVPGGDEYRGCTRDGQYHGLGVLRLCDGTVYRGQFVEGRYSGRGTIVFASGDEYSGGFSAGLFHGYGKYVPADCNAKVRSGVFNRGRCS